MELFAHLFCGERLFVNREEVSEHFGDGHDDPLCAPVPEYEEQQQDEPRDTRKANRCVSYGLSQDVGQEEGEEKFARKG